MNGNYCENENEFLVSKYLLNKYIYSDQVTSTLGSDFIRDFFILIRNSVEPHESHFCFYFRKNIFQFEEYNSCGQEGSHYAIKWSADNVLPNMKLSTSAKRLIKQS